MKTGRSYQVTELSRLAGVSVRTLHHYDEIGLLEPSGRTEAGYRLYCDEDVLRLQQILIRRELGIRLADIKRSLDDPSFDRHAALVKQHDELEKRAKRNQAMLRALDAALAALADERGESVKEMNDNQLSALFDGFDPTQYDDEVSERFGKTDAYQESARRTRNYTPADWERYKAESDSLMTRAAELFGAKAPADGPAARELAEQHRLLIDHWFYPCSRQLHAGLADMYEADTRFSRNIDKYAPALTAWWSSAIRANAERPTRDARGATQKANIRPYTPEDRATVLDLVVETWEPVFAGMRQSLPPFVYDSFYPDGWEKRQRADVGALLDEATGRSWVALEGETVIGFVVAQAHPEDHMGEVVIIGVHRAAQRRGVARTLSRVALDWMRSENLAFAMAETGEDPGHAPARQAYEKLGFSKWSVARYVAKL